MLPLLLVLLGLSGAWMGQLRWLAPYSTALTLLALGSLGLAAWRLFRPAPGDALTCTADGTPCSKVHVAARRWFWLVALLTLIPLLVPLAAPLFY